jgi:hypothetical protein
MSQPYSRRELTRTFLNEFLRCRFHVRYFCILSVCPKTPPLYGQLQHTVCFVGLRRHIFISMAGCLRRSPLAETRAGSSQPSRIPHVSLVLADGVGFRTDTTYLLSVRENKVVYLHKNIMKNHRVQVRNCSSQQHRVTVFHNGFTRITGV